MALQFVLVSVVVAFLLLVRADEENPETNKCVATKSEKLPSKSLTELMPGLLSGDGCLWPGVSCDADCKTILAVEWADQSLTGTISPQIGQLTKCSIWDLENNDVKGTVPSELGLLVELEIIHLEQNEFTGTIPPELASLTKLVRIDLERNQVTGTVPPMLVKDLAVMERLYLDNNKLEGTIPSELGFSKSLKRIRLNNNKLTGTIPVEIATIPTLARFYLHQNNLTGTIPAALGEMEVLGDLQLHDNRFTGKVSAGLEAKGVCSENFFRGEDLYEKQVCLNCPLLSVSPAAAIQPGSCICDDSILGVKNYGFGCGCESGTVYSKGACAECSLGQNCAWHRYENGVRSLRPPDALPGFWAERLLLNEAAAKAQAAAKAAAAAEVKAKAEAEAAEKAVTKAAAADVDAANATAKVFAIALIEASALVDAMALVEARATALAAANESNVHSIFRCYSPRACMGSNKTEVGIPSLGDGLCAPGRTGLACAECEPGTGGGPDGPCTKCPEGSVGAIIGILIAALIAITVGQMVLKKVRETEGSSKLTPQERAQSSTVIAASQLATYLQILALFGGMSMSLPEYTASEQQGLRGTFDWGGLPGISCAFGDRTPLQLMLVRWCAPLVGIVILAVSIPLSWVFALIMKALPNEKVKDFGTKFRLEGGDLVGNLFKFAGLFLTTLVDICFASLSCQMGPNGSYTVYTLPQVVCFEPEWFRDYLLPSVIFILFYVCGYIAALFFTVRQVNKRLVDSKYESRGKGEKFLHCRAGTIFWAIAMAMRSLVMNLILVLLCNNGAAQVSLMLLFLVFYGAACASYKPFVERFNNDVELTNTMLLVTMLFISTALGMNKMINGEAMLESAPAGKDGYEMVMNGFTVLALVAPALIILISLGLMVMPMQAPAQWQMFSDKQRADQKASIRQCSDKLDTLMINFDAVDWAVFCNLMNGPILRAKSVAEPKVEQQPAAVAVPVAEAVAEPPAKLVEV